MGKNNINIARMHFGREQAGEWPSPWSISTHRSVDKILDEIKKLPNILGVKVISM